MGRVARGRVLRWGVILGLSISASMFVSAPPAHAVSLPAGFSDSHVASLVQPTAIAFTPDGRMLVASKLGALRVISGGQLVATPAIDLTAKICTNSERGLLGIAVDPSFTTNQFIYLYYTFKKFTGCPLTNTKVPVNRVSRFVLPSTNVISPGTET
ncbi:MAG: PQQ-dependent sugar dehydrogenase, partial [Actinomycetota bacterium]